MLLYIVRHGDPDYAHDRLTPLGVRQAEAVGRRLASRGMDRVFASPLGRARQTADPLCELLGVAYAVEEWMSEDLAHEDFSAPGEDGKTRWAHGFYQNSYYREAYARHGNADWIAAVPPYPRSNAQAGFARVAAASDAFLARLGYRREGAAYRAESPNDLRVACFCHGGFGSVWFSHLLGVHPLLVWSGFDFTPTGVTILEFRNHADAATAPKCLCHADMSHLYAANIPMRYDNRVDV